MFWYKDEGYGIVQDHAPGRQSVPNLSNHEKASVETFPRIEVISFDSATTGMEGTS